MFKGRVVSICNYWGFREDVAQYLSFWINFQCFLSIRLRLWASSQNCVTKTNLFLLSLGFCLNRIRPLWLNLTEFICLYL